MKQLLSLLLTLSLLLFLCSCKEGTPNTSTDISTTETPYRAITEINHYVVEPDDKLHMSEADELHYKALMDGMLSRKSEVSLSKDKTRNKYYIDLLRQSPYYFFLSDCTLEDDTAHLSYAYSEDEQKKMLSFIDSTFLNLINTHANQEDNTLDKILNVHGAVARYMTYDNERTTDKQLDSPLFKYPDDEIYKALRDKKSVCYGFAYTLRFALLQLGIDCFCVYGPCSAREEGHMWNIFRYNDKFYTCDSAWDRADEGYAQLFHFGKTDKERESDYLTRTGFSSTFFEEYGEIKCVDETFRIFRGVDRYTYASIHSYYIVDYDGNEYIFNTETMEMK
ncbi:MAG: hypothetical protein IJO20_01505 [Ruminococcus sp.]|nr:hypothetical protein [Ruminococcus sp.]